MKGLAYIFFTITLFVSGFVAFPLIEEILNQDSGLQKGYGDSKDVASPSDWIQEDQITISKDDILLKVEGAAIARFANTNSMDPILDENSNGIEIVPQSPSEINIGDIIVYNKNEIDENVIHRVVAKGSDESGIYFLVRGDNNEKIDPVKVRFYDIKYVLIGVLY